MEEPSTFDDATQRTTFTNSTEMSDVRTIPNEPVAIEPVTAVAVEEEVDTEKNISNDSMSANESFVNLPSHLKGLAREIRSLHPTDLLTISEMTQRVTSREIYSLLPYTGSNWYLPEIKILSDDEPQWGLQYDWKRGLQITIGGRQLVLHISSWLLRAAVLALFWYMLYNVLGANLMTRGGYVWDPFVTFVVSAVVGGTICRILQVPPLLGVLWISIMWANIPTLNYLTAGIYKDVSKIAQRVGLTVVLARAGFSLSLKSIKPHMRQSLLLATLPYAIESVTHGLLSKNIFEYESYTWAFLQGCLCSTVSPAVVVPGVLYLYDQGYGKGHGPLSLLLSAVGIEVCCGVWASNFIIGLLFNDTPLATAIILGPVQFIGGILIGIGLGVAFSYLVEYLKNEADRLPNGKYAQDHVDGVMRLAYAIFLFFNVSFVFFGYAQGLSGGGAVMAVFFSATVAHMWIKDGNKELESHKTHFGQYLSITWDVAVMPALFSMVGININLQSIFNSTFFPKAILMVGVTTTVRMIVIFLCQTGSPYNWQQKLVVCGGYVGKATAQAAIGPTALTNVKNLISTVGDTPFLHNQKEMATDIMNLALLYILVCAPFAALTLTKVATRFLPRDMIKR